jgi:hypothetical protein
MHGGQPPMSSSPATARKDGLEVLALAGWRRKARRPRLKQILFLDGVKQMSEREREGERAALWRPAREGGEVLSAPRRLAGEKRGGLAIYRRLATRWPVGGLAALASPAAPEPGRPCERIIYVRPSSKVSNSPGPSRVDQASSVHIRTIRRRGNAAGSIRFQLRAKIIPVASSKGIGELDEEHRAGKKLIANPVVIRILIKLGEDHQVPRSRITFSLNFMFLLLQQSACLPRFGPRSSSGQ